MTSRQTSPRLRGKAAQAIAESVIALFFVIVAFLLAWDGLRLFAERQFVEHAAQRAARARSVGLNRFMMEKTARVAAIPASGESMLSRIGGEKMNATVEVGRIPDYLASETPQLARGILDYERWPTIRVDDEVSTSETRVSVSITSPRDDALVSFLDGRGSGRERRVSAEARIESHFPFYMYDGGR